MGKEPEPLRHWPGRNMTSLELLAEPWKETIKKVHDYQGKVYLEHFCCFGTLSVHCQRQSWKRQNVADLRHIVCLFRCWSGLWNAA
jgi:hypothetical protein